MSLHPTPVLKESPSQTAGPYVHIGMTPNFCGITGVIDADLGLTMLTPDTVGERIVISGRVIDGSGAPVSDAVLELWQADAEGSFSAPMGPNSNSAPAFSGWGRQPTQPDGSFTFETIKPGRVDGPDGKPMAPHVSLWIVARGINIGLQTRLYFSDEAEANAGDFVLNKIMDPRRRETLIARKEEGAVPRYVLDIHLQGDKETVFFDI
ncbi:MAG: protocatechuate 3,4-dioxygenase subunit alpha [Devosia sp.]|uniref:protocatechuate 3,4-dioxygenase subunit alpha n=1 Tax=Devosia sp. TaxID=1871048 RepID=UPI0024C68D34|nr:protocatechuate 3,4-dioxygenase subunit alpha [Devosia sp.]UYO01233.1 MAG: protocatechuate 3,4-dioxygenase subunit alpha [Devosia sp.]